MAINIPYPPEKAYDVYRLRKGRLLPESSWNERTDDQDVTLSAVTGINVVQ